MVFQKCRWSHLMTESALKVTASNCTRRAFAHFCRPSPTRSIFSATLFNLSVCRRHELSTFRKTILASLLSNEARHWSRVQAFRLRWTRRCRFFRGLVGMLASPQSHWCQPKQCSPILAVWVRQRKGWEHQVWRWLEKPVYYQRSQERNRYTLFMVRDWHFRGYNTQEAQDRLWALTPCCWSFGFKEGHADAEL